MEVLKKSHQHVWSMRTFLNAFWAECLSNQTPGRTADLAWNQLGPIFKHAVIASNSIVPRIATVIPSYSGHSLVDVVKLARRRAERRCVQVVLPCLHPAKICLGRQKFFVCCAPFTRLVPVEEWETLSSHLGLDMLYWLLTECSVFQTIGEKHPLVQIAGILATPGIKKNSLPCRKAKAKVDLPGQPLKKKSRLATAINIANLPRSTFFEQVTESLPGDNQPKRKKHHRGKRQRPVSDEESIIKYLVCTSVVKTTPRSYNGSLMFQHDTILYRSGSSANGLRWGDESPFSLGRDAAAALISTVLHIDVGSRWSFAAIPINDPDHPFTKRLTKLKLLTQRLADNHQSTNFMSLYRSAMSQAKRKAASKMYKTTSETSTEYRKTSDRKKYSLSNAFTAIEHHLETEGMISAKSVYCFTRVCIRRVIPEALLGGCNNMKLFLKNVRLFIRAGKERDFMLNHFMEGMTTSLDWLKEFRDVGSVQQCLLAKVVWWLMHHFVMVLLKLFFYITPTSGSNRNYLVWYPQNVWRSRQHQALRKLCNEKLIRNPAPRPQHMVANVRLLPKTGFSFRPITRFKNIRQAKKDPDLLKTKKFVKALNNRYSEIVPSRNSALTYSRWCQFLLRLKKQHLGDAALYFIVADIRDAYGSVKHDKLMELLKENMPAVRSGQCERKPLPAVQTVVVAVRTTRSYRVIGNWLTSFRHHEYSLTRGLQPEAIVMSTNRMEYWEPEKLVQDVSSLFENSYLKLGKTATYKVVQGIPQGWPLSEALCNFYYGEMTKQYLQEPLFDKTGILFRGVDDFLYVTTDSGKALRFLQTMSNGIEEYGCSIDTKKARTNLTEMNGHICQERRATFCGMTFDLQPGNGLGCLPDLQSYFGTDIVERMSLKKPQQPGKTLARRVPNFSLIKWSLLFVDNAMNSREAVIRNFYANFLMAAFHFHAIVKTLFNWERGQRNANFLMKQVRRCYRTVSKRTMVSRQTWHIKIPVNKKELKWLCYRAFHSKLRRTKSWYQDLLNSLDAEINKMESEMGQSKCKYLMTLTGKSLPAPFRKIRRIF